MDDDTRQRGRQVYDELLPWNAGAPADDGAFGGELRALSLDYPFGAIWSRPGLARRDRSLALLGMLIALRATNELRVHFRVAKVNGLTETEIAEVIYQASAYCGFPAAASARGVAREVFEADAAAGGTPGAAAKPGVQV